jgi:hypothetical protein
VSRFARTVAAVGLMIVVGCGGPTDQRADTGARATAEEFFAGLTANDPPRAYATLHPDTTRRLSAEQFAVVVRNYRQLVGFPAEKVHVRASDEHGEQATVHVNLIGHAGGHSRRYSDGVTLRREAGRWYVVLPPNFGKK